MRYVLRLIAITVIASLLSGCGSGTPSTTSSTAAPDLTGNWEFTTLYPGASTPQNIIYTGALSGQGANITGIFRTNTCFAATQDIDFTGSEDTKGNLTLTSTNLPNTVVTITGTVSSSTAGINASPANLLVSGSAPCAPINASFPGGKFPPLTGTYTVNLTVNPGGAANLTATLTQSAANSDGQFFELGTITITSGGCTNTFPVNTLFAGSPLTGNLTSNSGPPATAQLLIYLSSEPATFPIIMLLNITSTGCNAGSFGGSLKSQ